MPVCYSTAFNYMITQRFVGFFPQDPACFIAKMEGSVGNEEGDWRGRRDDLIINAAERCLALLLRLSPCVLLASHLNKHFLSWPPAPILFAKPRTPGARLVKVLSTLHCKKSCRELCLQHEIMRVPGIIDSRNPSHSEKFPALHSLAKDAFWSQKSFIAGHNMFARDSLWVASISKLANKDIPGTI